MLDFGKTVITRSEINNSPIEFRTQENFFSLITYRTPSGLFNSQKPCSIFLSKVKFKN